VLVVPADPEAAWQVSASLAEAGFSRTGTHVFWSHGYGYIGREYAVCSGVA
jgi:hypothetical protein